MSTKSASSSSVEHRRDRVTNCDYCSHPHPRPKQVKVKASTYASRTEFVVDGYGPVPVINGDPKWLPLRVRKFVAFHTKLMRPVAIHICNGSWSEAEELASILEQKGVLERLAGRENVFVARTHPSDAMEMPTFVCSKEVEEVESRKQNKSSWAFAHWLSHQQFTAEAFSRFPGCMQGRVMYVIPFSMGPIGGRYSMNAVQLTDSPFVVLNMRILTRVSSAIWDAIGQADFVRCVHSVGMPRPLTSSPKQSWPCNTERFFLVHRLAENEVWSYGSAFGENAFLSKKCLGLRLASYRGWKEGWLSLNAALIAVKDPSGKEVYGCVALPTGTGKTHLATMTPTLKGWQVSVLGDDIVWIRCSTDRKLYAMAPENGIYGCPSNATQENSANLIKMLAKNAILVNCATTNKGKFFWEAMESTLEKDENVKDWKGMEWKVDQKRLPNHINCHCTVFTNAAPNLNQQWEFSAGVPISFLIFGCKRSDKMPLVFETESWEHGIVLAAGIRTISHSALDKPMVKDADHFTPDEDLKTIVELMIMEVVCGVRFLRQPFAACALTHNPMCMRTYLSFNFADFLKHWLTMKDNVSETPKIFMVNFYQEGPDQKVIWPGFGENIRVLEWIVNRCTAPTQTPATSTAIGLLPNKLNTEGLAIDASKLLVVDKQLWMKECREISSFLNVEMGKQKLPIINKILLDISKRVSSMP